jgi:signal-transduction protein with cAMP-binding, CBS, and nucleotidyltransferase domain
MQDLILLRNKIEKLNQVHHIKILDILSNNNITFSENRNGIFFNMNSFEDKVINELKEYIKYVNEQESNLNETERLKQVFHNEFFKDNKDKNEKIMYNST